MKIPCFAAFLAAFGALTVQAEPLEIVNSNLSSLRLWVRPGEQLLLTNADICIEPGAACTLFVDRGARIEAKNTTFGAGLTVYHVEPAAEVLDLSNTNVEGTMVEGAPDYAAELRGAERQSPPPPAREISNSTLHSFQQTVRTGTALTYKNASLCENEGETPCVFFLDRDSQLSFINGKLGERLVIAHSLPLASGLSFVNTNFHGEFRHGAAPAPAARTVESYREENARVAKALAGKELAVSESPRGLTINLPDVYFEFDRSWLTTEAATNVSEIADVLGAVHDRQISIEGHTDSMGTDEYNRSLSESRAGTVRRALIERGLPANNLIAVGFGEQRPAADNETDLGRAKNRRVEVVLENRTVSRTNNATRELNRSTSVTETIGEEVRINRNRVKVRSGAELININDKGVRVRNGGESVDVNDGGVRVRNRGERVDVNEAGVRVRSGAERVNIDHGGMRVRSPGESIEIDDNGIRINSGGRLIDLGEAGINLGLE